MNDYTMVININPDYEDAHYNRAFYRGMLEDYKGAVEDYTKAIELDSNDGIAYFNRAASKYISGDLDGACKDARKSQGLGIDSSELIKLTCNN